MHQKSMLILYCYILQLRGKKKNLSLLNMQCSTIKYHPESFFGCSRVCVVFKSIRAFTEHNCGFYFRLTFILYVELQTAELRAQKTSTVSCDLQGRTSEATYIKERSFVA